MEHLFLCPVEPFSLFLLFGSASLQKKHNIYLLLLLGELAKKDYTLTICPAVLRVTEIEEIAVNPHLTRSNLCLAFIRNKAHVFISI